jgi:hypothetical protein
VLLFLSKQRSSYGHHRCVTHFNILSFIIFHYAIDQQYKKPVAKSSPTLSSRHPSTRNGEDKGADKSTPKNTTAYFVKQIIYVK